MDTWSQPAHGQADTAAPPAHARALIDEAIRQAERLGTLLAAKPIPPVDVSVPGYVIDRGIATGGQGHVYLAIQTSTGRRVALKIIHRSAAGDGIDQARFEREVKALAALRHANIVSLYDGGTAAENRFLVTDYIDGVPFDAYVNQNWLSVDATVRMFVKVCEAISAAHVRGIVHRDLKPSNIIVDGRGEPNVIDFGLAKLLERPDDDGLTMTGKFVGSLPWASPEQVEGSPSDVDTRTDVYALGLVLFHALTGRLPYDTTGSPRKVMEAIVRASPTTPTALGAHVDKDLGTVLATCLKKAPEERYQTAGEVARELRRYLAREAIEAKRDSTLYMIRKTVRRHRATAAAIFALVFGGMIYAWTVTVLLQRARLAERQAVQSADRAFQHAEAQRETLAFVVDEVSSKLASMPVAARVRQDILEGAFDRLTQLAAMQAEDDHVRMAVADTFEQLGEIARDLGEWESAAQHFKQAYLAREKALKADPGDRVLRSTLSISYVKYGDVLQFLGDPTTRLAMYERALEIDEALYAEDINDIPRADNLAWSYERLGDLARTRRNYNEARHHFKRQREVCDRLFASDPDNPKRLFALLRSIRQMCELAQNQDDMRQARRLSDEQLRVAEAFADEHARLKEAVYFLADSCSFAGRNALIVGDTEEARRIFTRALHVAQVFDPLQQDVNGLRLLVSVHDRLTEMANANREFDVAATYGRELLRIAEHLRRVAPFDLTMADRVFDACRSLAMTSSAAGWTREERLYTDRALSEAEQLLQDGFYPARFVRGYAWFLGAEVSHDVADPHRALEILEHHLENTRTRHPDDSLVLAKLDCIIGHSEEGVAILRQHWLADSPQTAHDRRKYEDAFRACGSDVLATPDAETTSPTVP